MPSPADIPDLLLRGDAWDDFVKWVHQIYKSRYARKELGRYWSILTKTPITLDMWRQIEEEPTTVHDV